MVTRFYGTLKQWQNLLAGLAVLLFLAVLFLSFLPSYDVGYNTLQAPSRSHWLGTNDIGQDVLTGILTALPNTVLVAVLASLMALFLAIVMAANAAIAKGWVAALILRLVDILHIIPSILVLLLFAAWIQPGFLGMILLIGLTSWHDDVRVLRALILRERTRENVAFARQMGAGWGYCLWRHILPSVWPAITGLFVQHIRQSTMKVAGLGFLGLTDPRLVTWGSMMQDALDYLHMSAALWLLLPPGLCLCLFLLLALALGRRLERYSLAEERDLS